MTSAFPPPPIEPLERLIVTDGLLINAQLWRQAHEYLRQRQNIHYQSLHQPGIVCGLGVRLIPAPSEVQAIYRDRRWVQIQPGIAIDVFGHPIIVKDPIDFRIATNPILDETLLLYLVISYVDPEKLQFSQPREIVAETFRIDEKNTPPHDREIEICRILLHLHSSSESHVLELENPQDVFAPGYNAIDLRYRRSAQSRPRGVVKVALADQGDAICAQAGVNLSYLLQSLPGLYSFLQADQLVKINLSAPEATQILDCDLLYLTEKHTLSITEPELELCQKYLATGGLMIIEVLTKDTQIEKLEKVRRRLQDAIERLGHHDPTDSIDHNSPVNELLSMHHDLQYELAAIETELKENFHQVYDYYNQLAGQLGTFLNPIDMPISRDSVLRSQPFLFAAFPILNDQALSIITGGRIMVLIGNLSLAWGLDEQLSLTRETIRTAQELGINILHYAWTRKQKIQLLK